MACRRKGKHRSRHHTHAVRAAGMTSWKLPPLAPQEETAKATENSAAESKETAKEPVTA